MNKQDQKEKEEFTREMCENIIYDMVMSVMKAKEFATVFKTSEEAKIEEIKQKARNKSEKLSYELMEDLEKKDLIEEELPDREKLRAIIKDSIKNYFKERDEQ